MNRFYPASYRRLRQALFLLPAERAHGLAILALRVAARLGAIGFLAGGREVNDPRLTQNLWGRRFGNPVGLAAGFDKDARAIRPLAHLGFGFLEVGTVTPRAQRGNPRPRLFRLARHESLQNSLGFNNAGATALAGRLAAAAPFPVPVGINLGKNRDTPLGRAVEDYAVLLERFGDRGDFYVVNVSSPNTPGLRDLQDPGFLAAVLGAARERTSRPVLVKLSPDQPVAEAVLLARAAARAGAAGIVVTNTTTDYSLVPGARASGGLSGAVLREKSFRLLAGLASELAGELVLVSAGGVDSATEAYRRLAAGASLVELYTALVFRGPGLVRAIQRDLLALLERDGLASVGELVGRRRGAGAGILAAVDGR